MTDQKIFFYNTATRKKDEFKPIEGNKVGIYSCGPTVYWNQHIGNMYAFLFDDILVRALRYMGFEVKWVVNITDVGHLTDDGNDGEDKMEKGAKREGLTAWEVAKKYEAQFRESLKLLNIETPDVLPRATEHIKEQIELIGKIEKNGYAYRTSDGIYFDTSKFADYAKFANLDLDKIQEGARVEVNDEKRNPSDFALWKFSPTDEKRQMEWDSPWGLGFPGWHIECTAMSTKYLGDHFDIHTGGEDHIPVHHTNEVAQGFGGLGHQTADFWMHNAFITLKGGKMSKSSGKIVTIQDLVGMGFDPMVYRLMVLSSHYRNGMDFSEEAMEPAKNAWSRLKRLVIEWGNGGKVDENYKKEFVAALVNDLAMPEAMALVWKLVKDEKLSDEDKKATLIDFDKVLGLGLDKLKNEEEDVPEEIKKLALDRQKAREEKNWSESDRLRDLIKEKGYLVEDSSDGAKLRKI